MPSPSVLLRGFAASGALLLLVSCAGSRTGGPRVSGSLPDPARELAAARSAVAADSLDAESWFRLALAWQNSGQPGGADSARVALERLLEIRPEHVKGLVHYGLLLEEGNEFDKALAQYRRASELAPEDPIPLVNLGQLLYFHYKKTYEAKTAFTKALELDPNNPEAHFNLGVMFADANMFGEAKVEWEKVLEVAHEGPAYNLASDHLEKIEPLLGTTAPSQGSSGVK